MPPVPPHQTSPFPNNRRAVRQRDPEQRQSKHGLVGRPRGPPSADAPPIRVLRTPDAANYLGLTASTLEKMRLTGIGPRFVRLGSRAVGYSIDALDSFIEAGTRTSTSDTGEEA